MMWKFVSSFLPALIVGLIMAGLIHGQTAPIENPTSASVLTLSGDVTGKANANTVAAIGGVTVSGSGGSAGIVSVGAINLTSSNGNILTSGDVQSGAGFIGTINGSSPTLISNIGAAGAIFGAASLTVVTGEVGLTKIAASGSAPGAGGLKFETVAGTNSGTCKIIAYAGTSTTPVTLLDNVGGGC